jgi:hypothetical protein
MDPNEGSLPKATVIVGNVAVGLEKIRKSEWGGGHDYDPARLAI